MRNLLKKQFVRFVLVGVLNTAFSYGVYALLLFIGLTYVVANFGALVLGVLFSFRTQGRLVFGNRDDRLLFRFAALWAVIFLFNVSLITLLIHSGLNPYWAGAAAIVPVTLLSYLIQKFLVFGHAKPPHANKQSPG